MQKNSIDQLLNLKGKVAIITGGSRGIGKAVAFELAQAGANIVSVNVSSNQPSELAQSIQKLDCRFLSFPSSDISKSSTVKTIVEKVMSEFGRIDILVNNAGIYTNLSPIETDDKSWEQVFDVNLNGAFYFSREVGKQMIKAKGGRIINMASINAFRHETDFVNYEASKAGLIGLTRSLAVNWGKYGITVNAIAPGLVNRDNLWEVVRPRVEAFIKFAPLGKLVEPEDIAHLVLFLCSSAASKITGQTIVIDSGVSLKSYMALTE
ncbi:MAG: SDR family oxidoreductase [Nitrososphaerota archaeon]|jgi:3-oxoacyl-[acyl-carrier protein] reductase|nr:SDR family oxidoreductase [Nitrososphaerota archaeon]MDG6930792.1 SDR family oxidoreductase [Nitrososphaerota archaeon]MDG6932958.1 SDR family oxidoreductase [Nitrososphaerota archaeon]MDG6936460.1 SDR family oxidoreductase [Nitrososphaerota archaeon]MDG6944707.1 SDR family oxidoreductase [Nitrososphaerota archaeon]